MRVALPLFLAAEALSLFGNSAISIVLPWLVLSRTGEPSTAGLVAAASAAPAVLAALVGGWLIDRVGRRRISVLADLGSAAAVAALVLVDQSVGLTVSWFIVLGVLGALFDVPGMTARETLMVNVAEKSGVSLDRIAGLRQMVFGVAFLAGPAVAGVLLAVLPDIQVIWLTAACSAAAAICTALLPIRIAKYEPSEAPGLSGISVVRSIAPLRTIFVIGFGAAFAVAPLLSVLLPARFEAAAEPTQLGLVLSAYAVGSIAGSALYAAVLTKRRWLAWVLSMALFTGALALIAPLAGFGSLAGGMVVAGIASGLMGPVALVIMTVLVPDAQRGRVFGLYNAAALIAAPAGLAGMAALLTVAPLGAGGWAVLLAWVPVAIYAVAAPALRSHIRSGEEAPVADNQPAR